MKSKSIIRKVNWHFLKMKSQRKAIMNLGIMAVKSFDTAGHAAIEKCRCLNTTHLEPSNGVENETLIQNLLGF
jgi:hypothetical protein